MSAAARRGGKAWPLVVIALLGLGMICAPVIFQMFHRAPLGAQMLSDFKPYMTEARLAGFQTDLRQIDGGVRDADTRVARRLAGPGKAAHRRFDDRYPGFATFQQKWGPIFADMKDLMDTIQVNRVNYLAMKGLPDFRLFPWFFVIPGVLVILLAAVGIAFIRRRRAVRWAIAGVGVALLLAPLVFGMWSAGPKGAKMMVAFKKLETRKKVETIQGYFGTIAVGQGTLRLELVPALRKTGLSDRQIAKRYPGTTTLNTQWIPILNDMTPMIGTMSDSVDNYEAVSALPSFKLFPWFFVAPGLLLAGLALFAGRRGFTTR
jgi:hypothetical protein